MVDRPFKAAIEADEAQMSNEIASALSKALGTTKVMKEANRLQGDPKAKGFPKKPDGKVILYYQAVADKAWKKLRTRYRGIEAHIEVRGYAKGKPYACCDAKYTGQVLGGGSRMIGKGDSIISIAKEVYGYEFYAETVWDHNSKVLGPQCKQLPVGFGIELPRVFVPDWMKPPKARIASGAKVSAVEVPAPPLEWSYPKTTSTHKNLVCGPVIVTISCTVEGSVKGVSTSPVSPSFTFSNYEAQFKKALGPYQTSFNLNIIPSENSIDISLFNSKAKGLQFAGSAKIVSGGVALSLGVATVSKKVGDLSLSGEFKASAKIQMRANPNWVSASEAAAAYGAMITVGGLVLLAGGALVVNVSRAAAAAELPGGAQGLKALVTAFQGNGATVLRPCLGL